MTLYNMECEVKRSAAVGTNGRQEKQVVATKVRCHIAPMASRAEIEAGYTVGTGYDIYTPLTEFEMKTGDQVVWHGATFNVRGVRSYELPRIGHRHVLATREGV